MSPDIQYEITFEEYSRFEALLLTDGIKVDAALRTTYEHLGTDLPSASKTTGNLTYKQKKFPYTLRQDGLRWSLILTDAYTHEPETVKSLDEVLSRHFPKPKVSTQNGRAADLLPGERPHWLQQIIGHLTCFVLLLLFFAGAFFTAYGIKKFFWN